MPIFRIAKDVSHRSEQPQMARAEVAVIRAFHDLVLDCIKTSCYRPPDPTTGGAKTLHDEGLASDYDADRELSADTWERIRANVQAELGSEYQVFAHDKGTGMHVHVEWDPPWRN